MITRNLVLNTPAIVSTITASILAPIAVAPVVVAGIGFAIYKITHKP